MITNSRLNRGGGLNILYVAGDKPHEWNSSEWRCAIPCRALAAARHRAAMMGWDDFNKRRTNSEREATELL